MIFIGLLIDKCLDIADSVSGAILIIDLNNHWTYLDTPHNLKVH